MKSLLPIISTSGVSTTILVNPERLACLLGSDRLLRVAKTKVFVLPDDNWEFLLVEQSHKVTLLSSRDMDITEPMNLDLIDVLGHQLALAPWQLLCLSGSFGRGKYVTYVTD